MFKRLKKREVTMRDRFITRVLLPPFILLVIIGGVGFWRLNVFLKEQAIDDLRTAAEVTAIRLEREIAIRETVLKNTAEEIASIKNSYGSDLAALKKNRTGCRKYYVQRFTFTGSPGKVCDVFSQEQSGLRPSLTLIEDLYIKNATSLQNNQIKTINQRLSSYKQFFPETFALIITTKSNDVVSSALSGDSAVTVEDFANFTASAASRSVRGEVIRIKDLKLAVFTFPTTTGGVVAAYDVNNPNYIRTSWLNTPIDSDEALAIIIEPGKSVVYPGIRDEQEFLSDTQTLNEHTDINTDLNGVQTIIVAKTIGDSTWSVSVASPEAIVFSRLRDTQFTILLLAGLFVVGFLWVGTYFIRKTTDSLAQLITGAMVYGSGRLDYKLDLNASEKEFTQLADTMRSMAQRIAQNEQEMDEKNKEFISIATHELRAPMTSIIGYLSMLKDSLGKKLTKEDTLLLDSAYDGTSKLRDLINDMLDAARLEGGREEFSVVKLEISSYIKSCLESMKITAEQNDITLTYDDKLAGNVFADEAKLRIILNNFVSNAVKYNHRGGKVKVSHSRSADHLVTAIASTGPPIPADQQAHMYEKFFRVDTPEHRKVTGTGIGMYVTKQYIETLNGKTWFTSSAGHDTIFYFSLPLSDGKNVQPVHTTAKPAQSNSKWIMRWRRHIR